ncbi:signal recognition particle-docking protein FtsY [Eubacteriales bacterium OttesenSCG-928-N14]|nr:signal recognition particle-docking protein FtsY [Eubacteriales bacterium OttesenSCG-928-N14]
MSLGLSKTRQGIFSRLGNLISRGLDEDFYESLEETLILADAGVETAVYMVDELRERVKAQRIKDATQAQQVLVDITSELLQQAGEPFDDTMPLLLLIVGVNGGGKTTSIGKLSYYFTQKGNSVLMAAADTFRAAAIDQLQTWADRTDAQLVRHQEGSDPAAVVFDAISAAKARGTDVVLCDTAGRLHNKKNLMDELNKIRRVVERDFTGNAKTLLILDANTGLNGLEQARVFSEAAAVDGILISKLDGTAKGGVVLAIAHEYKLPVWFCGTGETMQDLVEFDAREFAQELFG